MDYEGVSDFEKDKLDYNGTDLNNLKSSNGHYEFNVLSNLDFPQ